MYHPTHRVWTRQVHRGRRVLHSPLLGDYQSPQSTGLTSRSSFLGFYGNRCRTDGFLWFVLVFGTVFRHRLPAPATRPPIPCLDTRGSRGVNPSRATRLQCLQENTTFNTSFSAMLIVAPSPDPRLRCSPTHHITAFNGDLRGNPSSSSFLRRFHGHLIFHTHRAGGTSPTPLRPPWHIFCASPPE